MSSSSNHPLRRAYCGTYSAKISGSATSDSRFVINWSQDHQLSILDIFHMKQKLFDMNWIPVLNELKAVGQTPEQLNFRSFICIGENELIAALKPKERGDTPEFKTGITLDFENLVAVVHRLYLKEGTDVIWKFYTSGQEFAYKRYNRQVYERWQIEDDHRLQFKESFALPETFKLCGIVDSHLYGFPQSRNGKKDLSQLVHISLESKEQTTLQIDCSAVDFEVNKQSNNSASCIDRTLILHGYYQIPAKTRLFALSLDLLQWRDMNLEFPRPSIVIELNDNDNVLILNDYSRFSPSRTKIYRFVVNRPDRLTTLSWLTIQRQADKLPALHDFALSHLPKNSPLRCPF